MMRAHQQGAGQPRALHLLQRQQAALRLLLDVAAQQQPMTPVVQLHHATVVVAPRPGCQGPEHPHIQSLPMPLLTSAAGLGSRCKGEGGELPAHRHALQQSLPVARVIPVSVADDQGVDHPDAEPVEQGQDGRIRHVVAPGVAIPGIKQDGPIPPGDEHREPLPHVQHPHLPGSGSRPEGEQQGRRHRPPQGAPSRQVPSRPQQDQQGAGGHQPAGHRPPELQAIRQLREPPQHPLQAEGGDPEQAVGQQRGEGRHQHADERQGNDDKAEQRQCQQIEQKRQGRHPLEQQQLQGQQSEQQQKLQPHQAGAIVQQARQQQQGHRQKREPEPRRIEGERVPQCQHHKGPQPDPVARPVPL